MIKIAARGAYLVDGVVESPIIDSSSIVETPSLSLAGLQGLFMMAGNNLGRYYNEFTNNETWLALVDDLGFTGVAYTAGAEDHWLEFLSKIFWPDAMIVSPNVGMRCNPDMIEFYTGSSGGAANLHTVLNATGVDFLEVTINFCLRFNKPMVFTLNIARGTLEDCALYLAYLTYRGVTVILRFGNEQPTGETSLEGGAQDATEYLEKLAPIYEYTMANYPDMIKVLNISLANTVNWPHANLVQYITNNPGITHVNQYFWQGDTAGATNENTNIDDYFAQALINLRGDPEGGNPPGDNSLYGEILPRMISYYNTFGTVAKFHMGQWGCSLQRSGYVAQTLTHALLITNQLFEVIKFSLDNDLFFDQGIYLVVETAVDQFAGGDGQFTIDPHFRDTDHEGNVFLVRAPGEVFRMLKHISSSTYTPTVITITKAFNYPDGLDILVLKYEDKTYMQAYNFGNEFSVSTIEVNGVALGAGDLAIKEMKGDKLWASVGNTPGYNYFKNLPDDNPGITPQSIAYDERTSVGGGLTISKYSITVFEILDNANVTTIELIS